jgi:hypothetical protein
VEANKPDPQTIVVVTRRNLRSQEVDLTTLATGVARLSRNQKYRFTGRPSLVDDLLDPLRVYLPSISPDSVRSTTHGLRLLWRFLDAHEHFSVSRLSDLCDVHGGAMMLWLPTVVGGEHSYRQLCAFLRFARRYKNQSELLWPTIHDRVDSNSDDGLDPAVAARVFRALILEAQEAKAMFAEGARLASIGRDPLRRRAAYLRLAPLLGILRTATLQDI